MSIKSIQLIFLVALFLFSTGSRAAIAIAADTSNVEIRFPAAKKIAAYKDQKAFTYAQKKSPAKVSRLIPAWLRDFIYRIFKSIYDAGSAELYLIILLTIAIIAIIMRVNDINPVSLFRRKSQKLKPIYGFEKENVNGMNFPELIEKAVKQGNYRHAIRYHYLQVLAMLSAQGKIELREGKTNREYQQELHFDFRTSFSKLVFGFEYVWYGEFLPDEKQYLHLSSAFAEFNNSLQQ